MNKAIISRRSIRKYKKDKPVTKEQLASLARAAMLAPSARNSRPWEFIAITKREILDELKKIHPYAPLETAAAAIIVVAIPQEEYIKGFFPQCCSAATQNILIEAAEIGLGACWCGIYPREERMVDISALLNIKEPKIPFSLITVGHPDEEPEMRGFFEESKITYIL